MPPCSDSRPWLARCAAGTGGLRWFARASRSPSRRRSSASTRSAPRSTRSRAAAQRGGLGVRTLSDLSQRLSPLRDELRDKLADLEPRLADLDARLKGLGPAPAQGCATRRSGDRGRARAADAAARRDRCGDQAGAAAADPRHAACRTRSSDRRRSAYARNACSAARPMCSIRYFWRDVVAAMPDYGARLASSRRTGRAMRATRAARRAWRSAGLALAGLLVLPSGWCAGGGGAPFVARIGDALRHGARLACWCSCAAR